MGTVERIALEIDGYADLYEVTEDGQIFSIRKQKFLKPFINREGYVLYRLTPNKGFKAKQSWFMAHRLVAMTFIGPPPSGFHRDCHHKDRDKSNNHFSNLEWVTRSENILRSYRETDRVSPRKGKTYGPHSPETITLMRTAKEKGCYAEQNGEIKEYGSVQELLDDLGIYRKAFNRAIKSGNPYKGVTFGYL